MSLHVQSWSLPLTYLIGKCGAACRKLEADRAIVDLTRGVSDTGNRITEESRTRDTLESPSWKFVSSVLASIANHLKNYTLTPIPNRRDSYFKRFSVAWIHGSR